jgi:hypothetical protein
MNRNTVRACMVCFTTATLWSMVDAGAQMLGKDAQIIAGLRQGGIDPGQPHSLEFQFFFATRESASRVAAMLIAKGFGSRVLAAKKGSGWTLIASKSMRPDEAALSRLRMEFSQLATQNLGEYEKWTAVDLR